MAGCNSMLCHVLSFGAASCCRHVVASSETVRQHQISVFQLKAGQRQQFLFVSNSTESCAAPPCHADTWECSDADAAVDAVAGRQRVLITALAHTSVKPRLCTPYTYEARFVRQCMVLAWQCGCLSGSHPQLHSTAQRSS